LHLRDVVKLVVAALLLAGLALLARFAVEHVAPEPAASASASVTETRRAGDAPRAGTVEAVRFSGPGLRAAFLRDVVVTREGAPFRADQLESDRLRVFDALVARGHLDAKVGEPRVTWHDQAAWVDFPCEPGPVYVVRAVRVEGRGAKRHPGVANVPTLRSGDVAASEDIEASADLLRAWLEARDLRARVTVATDVEPYGKQVDIRYVVQ
jgi:hypothetical protein